MRSLLSVFAASLMASSAFAAEINIPLGDDVNVETVKASYICGEKTIHAEYINADAISLVVLDFDESKIVASNVLSGSGARYAGAQYIWWTKGDTADLYNLMQEDGENTPIATCKQND